MRGRSKRAWTVDSDQTRYRCFGEDPVCMKIRQSIPERVCEGYSMDTKTRGERLCGIGNFLGDPRVVQLRTKRVGPRVKTHRMSPAAPVVQVIPGDIWPLGREKFVDGRHIAGLPEFGRVLILSAHRPTPGHRNVLSYR